jgi:DNA replication and repair protein RecF
MRRLAVEAVGIRGLRNLASVDVELGRGLNVVWGDNGQGKTNLLEAVYLLATSRSFRTARLQELVAHGGDTASVRASIREDGDLREQSVGIGPGARVVRIDGKRPPTLAAYAVRTPTVVFHPGIVALSAGPGGERRKLLDRVALYASPTSLADAEAYGKAIRARQRVLEQRGDRAADLDGWEVLAARHGTALSDSREAAAGPLSGAAEAAFARIGSPGLALRASYQRSAAAGADAFQAELAERRTRDRVRGAATMGPHRDDLLLELGGMAVRGVASQGQHRATVLSLVLAEIAVIARIRSVQPVLLLDDVSSELDRERSRALFVALSEEVGQVLLTTTRPELIDTGALSGVSERRDFRVVRGQVAAL